MEAVIEDRGDGDVAIEDLAPPRRSACSRSERYWPSELRKEEWPKSTWACSPGAVSNRVVAFAARRSRSERKWFLRIE